MKLCSDKAGDCYPICDYCRYYSFDARMCHRDSSTKDPSNGCLKFECYTLTEDNDDSDR